MSLGTFLRYVCLSACPIKGKQSPSEAEWLARTTTLNGIANGNSAIADYRIQMSVIPHIYWKTTTDFCIHFRNQTLAITTKEIEPSVAIPFYLDSHKFSNMGIFPTERPFNPATVE